MSGVRRVPADGHSVEFASARHDQRPTASTAHSEGLTGRESEVLSLIVSAMSNREVANHLSLSLNSVKSYIRSIYRKIGVSSRSEAVSWAIQHGFRADHSVPDRLNEWL